MIIDLSGKELPPEEIPQVKDEVYQEVFALVDWVLRTKPWQWMRERNCFLFRDPQAGKIWLVSLQGRVEQECNLRLYPLEDFLHHRSQEEQLPGAPLLTEGELAAMSFLEVEFLHSAEMQDLDYELNVRFAPEEWDDFDQDVITLKTIRKGGQRWYAEEEELSSIRAALLLLRLFYEEELRNHQDYLFPLTAQQQVTLPLFTCREGLNGLSHTDWEVGLQSL